jgi:hypothetical protein
MAGVHNQPDHTKDIDLDCTLDAALEKYAAVEPRTGLEDRILANLRAAQEETPVRSWWRWQAVAALTALVIIVAAVALRSGRPSHPEIAKHPPATEAPLRQTTVVASSGAGNTVHPQTRRMIAKVVSPTRPAAAVAAVPKLDQFPSPQPLSQQEQMLASYVAQFRPQAVLIARVMNEELQRDRMAVMGDSQGSEGLGDDAEQQTTNQNK